MKALFSFMIRWVIPLLGLIALSLIIWFVGPLLDVLVPEGRRWALIILVFGVWLAYRIWRIVQAQRQAAEVMRSLAAETQALLAIRQSKPDAARNILKRLSQDVTAPDGVRGRANGLLAQLGGGAAP